MAVKIETLTPGQGDGAKDGDTLVVHYCGVREAHTPSR